MGTAYKLRGRYFSGELGYVTPIEKVYITDIDVDTSEALYNGVRIDAMPVPLFSNHYRFKYYSLTPDVVVVDENTGIVTVVSTGDAIIEVLDEYTYIRKQFSFEAVFAVTVDLTSYLVSGRRPQAMDNANGSAYKLASDASQCAMRATDFDISDYSRIAFPTLAWWVSGGGRNYDSKVIIFLDSNSTVVAGYAYGELFPNAVNGSWNYNEPFVLDVPDGAKYLCVNTPLVSDDTFRAPIIRLFPREYVALESISVQVPESIKNGGGATAVFTPSDATYKSVEWSIVSGSQYATINENGYILVSQDVENQRIVIRATSTITPSIYGEAETVVSYLDAVTRVFNAEDFTNGSRVRWEHTGNGSSNSSITISSDAGQSMTLPLGDNRFAIPSGFKRVEILPFVSWVSSATSADQAAVIIATENNLVEDYTTRPRTQGPVTTGTWNKPARSYLLDIMPNARYLYLNTCPTTETALFEPITVRYFNYAPEDGVKTMCVAGLSLSGSNIANNVKANTYQASRGAFLQNVESLKGDPLTFTDNNAGKLANGYWSPFEIPEDKTKVTVRMADSNWRIGLNVFNAATGKITYDSGWVTGGASASASRIFQDGDTHFWIAFSHSNGTNGVWKATIPEDYGLTIEYE